MKKIKDISEYPFIDLCNTYNINSNEYINTEERESAALSVKAILNRLADDTDALDTAVDELVTSCEDVGFINGYITAVRLMKGELM